MLSDAMLRDWLIKPTGDLGGRITLEDVLSFEPKHDLIGVYIEELPNLNVITDPFGTFLLRGIPEGDYTLRIVRSGYEPMSLPVEVIGLTRQLTSPLDEPLSLQIQADPMAHWTHELEVTLQEIHQEIDSVEVNLIPVFPHQTEERTLSLSRSEQRGDELVFSSDPMPYAPHDLFTVQVRGQSLQGSRRFNVNVPAGETTRTELRARGYIPHEYAIVDLDQDGIPDDEDSDRDGDLCLNEDDLAPDDPFICQPIAENPAAPSGGYPTQAVVYEVSGVQFRMRDIPAGDGVASFLMAETEVTQELYQAVMGENPSHITGNDQQPVDSTIWRDGVHFCNTLSDLLGLTSVYQVTDNGTTMDETANGFRLPFEAEWEWAARGGQAFIYAGSDILDDVAWCGGNSGATTHPVGQKQPNGYGLFDLSGSISEWTNDDFDNPGPYNPEATKRVIRGGSWGNSAEECQLEARGGVVPGLRYNLFGFRLSRSF